MTAINAAASPAIQNGPVRAGASCASAELGDPLMASNSLLMSRRKLSRVTSAHLLEGQVGPKAPGSPIDSRLGGRRRYAQCTRDFVQWQVEIEIEDEGQPLAWAQPADGSA